MTAHSIKKNATAPGTDDTLARELSNELHGTPLGRTNCVTKGQQQQKHFAVKKHQSYAAYIKEDYTQAPLATDLRVFSRDF